MNLWKRWKAVAQGAVWRWRPGSARMSLDGFQEVDLVIKGRYLPNRLVVEQGVPTRINFLRLENNPCSDWVVFSTYGLEMPLPPFTKVSLVFFPNKSGEFLFTCRMGVYRGKLVVVPPRQNMAAFKGTRDVRGKT